MSTRQEPGSRLLLAAVLSSGLLSFIALGVVDHLYSRNEELGGEEAALSLAREVNEIFFKLKRHSRCLGELRECLLTLRGDLGPDNDRVLPALITTRDQLNASIVYLIDSEGTTVACTPYGDGGEDTLTGENYRFRPYFKRAMLGDGDVYLALGVTTAERGVYYSAPVFSDDRARVSGVVVIKMGMEKINSLFNQHEGIVLLVSDDGVIFASSGDRWLYRTALPLTFERLDEIRRGRQFGNEPLLPAAFSLDSDNILLDGVNHRVAVKPCSLEGWRLYMLRPVGEGHPYHVMLLTVCVIFIANSLFFLYLNSSLHRRRLRGTVEMKNEELTAVNRELKKEMSKQKATSDELLKAKDKAEAASKIKSEFLANMSHEIRTPINGIIGAGELLLDDVGVNGDGKEHVGTIIQSAESLLGVMNAILDFSRMESDNIEIEYRGLSLLQLVDSVAARRGEDARAKGLVFEFEYVLGTPEWVLGDAGRLRQVLDNLVGNAVKFTQRGKVCFRVSSERKEGGANVFVFEINDTGIGIRRRDLRMIFEPFRQADGSYTRKYGGAGLGLSLAKGFVQMMGGELKVKSRHGRGSEFVLRLGMSVHEPEVGSGVSGESIDYQRFKGLRVLVIDDSAVNWKILGKLLRDWGFKVSLQGDSVNALELLTKRKFDMVIVDFQMSGCDGLELGRRIRGLGGRHVLVAASSIEGTQEGGHRFGHVFDAFLSKPVTQADIREVVGRLFPDTVGSTSPKSSELPRLLPDAKRNTSPRILVVEDNPVNLKLAAKVLQCMGCRVDTAEDGKAAFAKFSKAKRRYDLILMDCQMPEMNGFDTTREIRRLETGSRRRRSVIIAMTANAMEGDRELCLESGMDDYLAKPVKKKDIAFIVEKYCGIRTQ